MDNRRSFRRLPAVVDVACRGDGAGEGEGFSLASSRDISVGGLGVVLQSRHQVGSLLSLAFVLPGTQQQIRARGRIAWVDEFTVGPDKAFDTGIEFVDLTPEDRRRIDEQINHRFAA